MWIDIIQAYADALSVATTQRPPPTSARESRWTPSREDAEARLAPTPSTAVLRRVARWLVRKIRYPGGPYAERLGSDADLTAAPTSLKGCG